VRGAGLMAARPFGSEAPKRSLVVFDFALFFNGLDISLHILRAKLGAANRLH
jgi:hypothetical protein